MRMEIILDLRTRVLKLNGINNSEVLVVTSRKVKNILYRNWKKR